MFQIAAKANEAEFSVYILPRKGISDAASRVTGLTVGNGLLFKGDSPVVTTPIKTALTNFVNFLKENGAESVILVAHNGNK